MKYNGASIFLMLILIVGILGSVHANTSTNNMVYVSVGGNDLNDGLTEATSKRTIQNAINTVTNGGTVHVKPGIYKENIKIEKDVNLISTNREKTITQNIYIDSWWKGKYNVNISGFTLSPGTITTDYENVTIRDTTMQYLYARGDVNLINSTVTGKNNDGGGLFHQDGVLNILNSSIIDCKPPKDCPHNFRISREGYSGINIAGVVFIKNSVIARNHGSSAGGIQQHAGSLTVVDSVIKDNIANTNGGGIYSKSTLNITNCQITGNKANGNGGGIYSANAVSYITNSIISGNEAVYGGGIYSFNGMLYLEGLKINKNKANYGGGIYNDENNVLNIRNTIIQGNRAWYKGGGIYNKDLIYIDKITQISGNKWHDLSGNPLRSIETGDIIH